MNLKNLFKLSAYVFMFTMVLGSISFGATKWYVDVQNGLDGYNGLQATVGGPGVGPKQTINNAIAAASSGDTISVAYANGNLYNEVVAVGGKKLVFLSSGGSPVVVGFTINNTLASPDNITTFQGPFKISSSLVLTLGKVLGASNLTVGGAITRTAGSVDSQLNYSGVVSVTYNGGLAITSGPELPLSTDAASLGSLTTTGAGTVLTLSRNEVMNGTLATGDAFKLGGNTLTINGSAVAETHAVGGAITDGTLAFVPGATGVNVNGNFDLPNVSDNASGSWTLNLNTNTVIGNVTASGKATVNIPNALTVGVLTNNGSGSITPVAATLIDGVANTSSGSIVITTAAAYVVTNNVSQSGSGLINFNGGAVSIGGNVTVNPTLALTVSVANSGEIVFTPNVNVTITGSLSISSNLSGATGASAATNWTNNGDVRFLSTTANVTITGGVSISTSHAITYGGFAGSTVNNNGGVSLATTSGLIDIPGGIAISTIWPDIAGGNVVDNNNGSFTATARIAGSTFGTAGSRVGAINVTSAAKDGTNGNFATAETANVGFFGTSVSTSGAAGGYIIFGNETLNLSGSMTNGRTTNNAHIQVGTAPLAGVNISIGGNLDNQGASTISFAAFNGAAAENFAVNGTVSSEGAGTITVAPTAALTGTGLFQFGGVNLQNGTIMLTNAPVGAVTMDVLIKGTGTFVGGTFNVGTTVAPTTTVNPVAVAAGDRVLQLGGLVYQFSSATTTTDFSANGNVVMWVNPTTVVSSQTITGAPTTTVWPGMLIVDNPTGLQPAVTFNGGNFRVLDNVAFNQSQVKLDNVYIFVGGQLAPNIGTGDFYNWSGYTTNGQAFVSMNGNAAANAGGTGTFENFEVDMAAGVTFAANATFTKTFNLTNGAVTGGAFIIFNNATTYPTIVRNNGSFAVAPTFTSMVNVYYIGLDKPNGNELPVATNKLNDLTVATTNGAVAGKGRVLVTVATTVNGKLTIFPNQALLINGVNLTMAGSTMQIDGVFSNRAAEQLILARTAGTAITGSGWLPDITIKKGSVGNTISGINGIVTGYLGSGAGETWGGAGASLDFAPATVAATGGITYDAASGAGGLDVAFGAGALNGTNFGTLTTVNAANVFSLSANATGSQITHVAGKIDVGAKTLTLLGATQAMTEGATIVGTGSLVFKTAAATTLTTTGTTIANGPVIDVANLTINTTAANFALTGADLYVNGNLTLNGTAGSLDITAGRILYAQGQNVSLAAGTSFIATGGTGILYSNVTSGVQTLSASGAVTIANLTVADSLKLSLSGVGAAITVTTAFKHTGGQLDFSSYDLTISGTYDRTGGTYKATSGYLVINNVQMNQGSTDFTIPNLKFTANAAATKASQTGIITVTGKLYVGQPGTVSIKSANTGNAVILTVAAGGNVYYSTGTFDEIPTYTTINLHALNNGAIDAKVWPAVTGLVQTLEIDNGLSSATLPGDRQINTALTLTSGNLSLTKKLTVKNGSTINAIFGTLTQGGGGSVVYGIGNTVNYFANGAAYTSDMELPATVKTLNISRNANSVNSVVTITSSVTVSGDLTIKNDLTTNANATITLKGDLTIAKDAFALATDPVMNFGSSLTFAGTYNQAITVPKGGSTIGDITINTSTTSPVLSKRPQVILHGGDLETGIITFESGLFVVPDSFTVTIPTPTLGVGGGQGFIRNVADGNISHIVGKVSKKLTNNGTLAGSSEPRSEFPVGSMMMYRPAAITFNMAFGVPTNPNTTITVSHVDSSAGGAAGLPIKDGVAAGIDVSRYPAMYWSISSSNSLSNSVVFDLELQASGFSDFDDINNVRIIRRYGIATDITNQWLLQGISTSYDNAVNEGVPTIIQKGTYGGLRSAGAVFTLGMTSKMSVANAIADQTLMEGGDAKTVDLSSVFTGNRGSLTFTAQSSNATKVTVSVKGAVLTLTPVAKGDADITVVASDAANTDFYATTFHVTVEPLTDVKTNDIPKEFALMQNYPNPFNPTTNIKFDLPKESNVTLKVYNVLGEEVATLVNTVMPAGHQEVKFDATRFASGLYIYRIQAGSFVQVKKMMLMK